MTSQSAPTAPPAAAFPALPASKYTMRREIYKSDPKAGDIPAYIFYDPASTSTHHPIAVMYHIGGFVMGTAHSIPKNQIDYLVSHGFVVVAPEYRLAPQVSIKDGPMVDALAAYIWSQTKLPSILSAAAPNYTIDPTRSITIGYSAGAFLAHSIAARTFTQIHPPVAVLDFYGVKFLSDPSYREPLSDFQAIPDLDESFLNSIYTAPTVPISSGPMFSPDGKPLLQDPRAAWMLTSFKKGTYVSALVPDGNYEELAIEKAFEEDQESSAYPPTFFVHGTVDPFVKPEMSERAHAMLKKAGRESELLLAEGVVHVFDLLLKEEDKAWQQYVRPALEWAVRKGGL